MMLLSGFFYFAWVYSPYGSPGVKTPGYSQLSLTGHIQQGQIENKGNLLPGE